MSIVILIALLAFAINIPFGYLRKRARKFSVKWFVYVHLSIPVVVAARLLTNTDYRFIPIFILAAVAGQIMGGKIGA
jgi:hypothetical protein